MEIEIGKNLADLIITISFLGFIAVTLWILNS